jgi:hypothetical protein
VTDAISLGGVVVALSAAVGFYLRRSSGFTLQHAPAE